MKAPRPVTFEEFYSGAKLRVAKKSALERKGGTSPHLLQRSGSLPDFPRGLSGGRSLRLSSNHASLPQELEVALWASEALATVPREEEEAPAEGAPVEDEEQPAEAAPVPRRSLRRPADQPPSRRQSIDSTGGSRMGSRMGSKNTHGSRASNADPSERRGSRRSRKTISDIAEIDPGLAELLEHMAARNEGSLDGFSEKELARMETAFGRFKVPGEVDLYADDIGELLNYLGHTMTAREHVEAVLRQVTMYDYMDFEEFLTFMEKYIVYEREMFYEKFQEYDVDHSGEITVQELRGLAKALGITPLRQMIVEALDVVDQDNNGQLNFDELCTFLAVYRHAEGFTRAEVAELRRQFDRFSVDGGGAYNNQAVLPPESLSDALVQVFGLQVSELTVKMGEQLASGQGLQKSTLSKSTGEPECLHFPEFLIFARKIREEEYAKCQAEHPEFRGLTQEDRDSREQNRQMFEAHDTDRSGGISDRELRRVLRAKGYTPLRNVLDEIIEEVYDGEWEPDSELDLEEFFDFMLVFDRRDGFLMSEVENMRKTYDRFDEDQSGEVSAIECSTLFRYIGYRVTLDDLRDHVAQVDANGSGQLDFREFMRLMRLYREKELTKIQEAFDGYKDGATDLLPRDQLHAVLQELGQAEPYPPQPEQDMNFDDLVELVDSCRAQFVAKERKKAGFSDEDLDHFQDLFDKFDKDKSGEIDAMELQNILKEFGWEPKSREEQQELMKKLDEARGAAREAGIEDEAPDGSANLKFWTFIQLLRMLRTEADKAEEAKLAALQRELRFTEGEVEDFRQVFRSWVKRGRMLDGRPPATAKDKSKEPEQLTRDTVRRLIRSLGISVSPTNAELLDGQIEVLDEQGRRETAQLGFMQFLKLMRWLLDTDFAGINDAAAKLS